MDKEQAEQEMGRRLRGLHPLYRTLSGDVLWELFLELGFSDEECGDLLDARISEMHQVLSVMRQLESGQAVGYVYTAEKPESLCERCATLVGKKVVSREFGALPPFAVGCGLSCRPLRPDRRPFGKNEPGLPMAEALESDALGPDVLGSDILESGALEPGVLEPDIPEADISDVRYRLYCEKFGGE